MIGFIQLTELEFSSVGWVPGVFWKLGLLETWRCSLEWTLSLGPTLPLGVQVPNAP